LEDALGGISPDHYCILGCEEVEPAVRNKSIAFLICNPAIYVDLEVRYGVTRTMTLRNLVGKQIVSEFGGVVFCRNDRIGLQKLQDVRGQRLAATGKTSFGGWYMALREFKSAGIDPERDSARLFFLDSHPAVVRAVLSGEADMGTVRTDTLDHMVEMQDALVESTEKLAHQATHDPLTGLPNRRAILDRLSKELALARRHDDVLAVGMFDIDHFKQINALSGLLGSKHFVHSL
jgi:hypothetical protein